MPTFGFMDMLIFEPVIVLSKMQEILRGKMCGNRLQEIELNCKEAQQYLKKGEGDRNQNWKITFKLFFFYFLKRKKKIYNI